MVGSRVNRGAGHGLEIIPVRYIFQGHGKAMGWIRRKVVGEEARVETRFNKCLKNEVHMMVRKEGEGGHCSPRVIAWPT